MNKIDPRMMPCDQPIAKAWDIAHVSFARPDLEVAGRFLGDFGLTEQVRSPDTLYCRAAGGYGPCYIVRREKRARFLGLGLFVQDLTALQAVARLPEASQIEPAEGWSEGQQVRLTDPAGNEVRALFGPRHEPDRLRLSFAHNLDDRLVRLNSLQRPVLAPATIKRLGHAVLGVVAFFRCVRWYMDVFGLLPSDIQTIGRDEPALVFMRCDRGDVPSDHHTLVLAQNVDNVFSHCAFECIDIDDIAMGQEYLNSRRWLYAWGVGRHLLGSQIFDYWRDPWGDKVEHFVDSDMFTADRLADVSPLSSGGLYQWGPPVPADFEMPKLTPALVVKAIRNIRASDEMTFGRMRRLFKAISGPPRPWVRH